MDGRELEANPAPSWMGYSVGRWDGDTLVVDSVGFNDKTWVNQYGLSHTEALRVRERYRRLVDDKGVATERRGDSHIRPLAVCKAALTGADEPVS